MRLFRVGSFGVLFLAIVGSSALAQDRVASSRPPGVAVFAGLDWASHWDDETFLGRGPLLSGGVSVPVGSHLKAEAEFAWATHHRDAGYLVADGRPMIATGRLAYLFRDRLARTRPFVSGGVAVLHTTGHFTTRSIVAGPGGVPVVGPETRQDWRATQAGWEVGAGLEIAGPTRVVWRPQLRWMATTADPSFAPGSLEPPLVTIRAGVSVSWSPGARKEAVTRQR